MSAQICESCKYKEKGNGCYCSPNSTCTKYNKKIEESEIKYFSNIERNISDIRESIRKESMIKIKYFSDIEKINKIDKGDWIDLRSAIDIDLKQGEYKLIPLGVGMKLPKGYEAHIVPRSSTFKNFGIIQTNHQGE